MNAEPKPPQENFLKRHPVYTGLFACLTVVAFSIIFIRGMTSSVPHPFGRMVVFALLYALGWALTITLLIAFGFWVACWRNFKRFLFGLACLLTLIALIYAEEDWRGKHEWNNYQQEWQAKGGKFNWLDYIPALVPDDQNFAMSPVWIARIKYNFANEPQKAQAWYGDQINSDDVAKFYPLMPITTMAVVGTSWSTHLPTTPDLPVLWTVSRVTNLKPWQSYYRDLEEKHPDADIRITPQPQSPAADVLLALSKFDPAIEQLQKDSALPDSRFPVQYNVDDPGEILLPHLQAVKQTSAVLELRALAELQNGQTDQAADDVQLMLRLVDSVQTEPFIITHLVRMAVMQSALQCIYEGASRHQWSDAQLAEMDAGLAKINYPADFQYCVQAETAGHAQVFKWIEEKRSRGRFLLELIAQDNNTHAPHGTLELYSAAFHLAPQGWFYQNDMLMAKHGQAWAAVPSGGTLSPAAVLSASNTAVNILYRHSWPFDFFARILTPELSNYAKRTAFAQESADLARIAIALERYYLAHGQYPATLDPLAPKYLAEIPADIINGQPLQYRTTPDGQFVLYSVGWNGTDDGGVAVASKNSSIGTGVNVDQGDWVWKYPAK